MRCSDEFFGVGAVEAMAAGAVPVYPYELSYPELIPEDLRDLTLYRTEEELHEMLAAAVSDQTRRSEISKQLQEAVRRFSWDVVGPQYDKQLA